MGSVFTHECPGSNDQWWAPGWETPGASSSHLASGRFSLMLNKEAFVTPVAADSVS